jgi:hypothetical protein
MNYLLRVLGRIQQEARFYNMRLSSMLKKQDPITPMQYVATSL